MDKSVEHFIWAERFRPQKIDDCILPEATKQFLKDLLSKGEIPHLLFAGGSGIGKTTAAKAIAKELEADLLFLNASDEGRYLDTLRTDVKQFAVSSSLFGGKKIVVLDESDNLTGDGQDALRGMLEEFSKNCRFIFTCNYKNKLKPAIQSRLTLVDFSVSAEEKKKLMLAAFKRACQILDSEGVTYDKAVIAKLVERMFPDLRSLLNELQKHSTSGSIDTSILKQVLDNSKFEELFKFLKDKDFKSFSTWAAVNVNNDSQQIYSKMTELFETYMKKESIPQAIWTTADYAYKSSFVMDQSITMKAYLIELARDCEYR